MGAIVFHSPVSAWTICLSLLFLMTTQIKAQEPTFVYETIDGVSVLRHEVIVAAPLAEVWDLFTTEKGVRSWITPVASRSGVSRRRTSSTC